jgi:aminoglycoside 6'-N-acetyltransferase
VSLRLRSLERCDFALVSDGLAAPHVSTWWRASPDPAAVRDKYERRVAGIEPVEVVVVEENDVAIGLIQRYRLADFPEWERNPEWKRAVEAGAVPRPSIGLDYLIGTESHVARGLGGQMITTFVASIWDRYPEAVAVVASVEDGYRRSWRSLEKAGFGRVWAGVTSATADPVRRSQSPRAPASARPSCCCRPQGRLEGATVLEGGPALWRSQGGNTPIGR